MNKNFYNEEESQFQGLRAVLKELPKIKAESNFEFNLMTRIHNKQFESASLKKEKFTLFSFLKPAIAVGAIAILVFAITQNQTTEIENPFSTMPKIRTEVAEKGELDSAPKEIILAENKNKSSENLETELAQSALPTRRLIVQDNDVITVAHENFPFPDNSFDLDLRMRDSNAPVAESERGVLAGAGLSSRNSNRVYFEGFYTGNKTTKKTIDSLKNESFKDSDSSKAELEQSNRK